LAGWLTTVQVNLAPASQPTPPLVRYPGGVGLKIHAVFYVQFQPHPP
jgi:hypothetical protein